MSRNTEISFQGKTALITGAGSGIGLALARALASEGTRLILVGRSRDKLNAAASTIEASANSEITCHACDLSDPFQLERLIESLEHSVDTLDMLIHSAGDFCMDSFSNLPVDKLDHLFRVNLRAPYRLTQGLLPLLRASQGDVVFINSTAALHASQNWAAYAAVKAGLEMLADSIRSELDEQGVRVLSVYPGRTATPMQKEIFRLENRTYNPEELLQPEDIADQIVHILHMPQTAEVADLVILPRKKVPRTVESAHLSPS
jgi:short-subunit dehydrogenase